MWCYTHIRDIAPKFKDMQMGLETFMGTDFFIESNNNNCTKKMIG